MMHMGPQEPFLCAGQPVTFAVVGGSISAGVGPIAANNSYVSRVFHWVNTTFPHTHHQFHVFALPATTSAYYAPCVTSTSLPSNTDLVLVEFTFNDSEMAFFHHTVDDRTRCANAGLPRCTLELCKLINARQAACAHLHGVLYGAMACSRA